MLSNLNISNPYYKELSKIILFSGLSLLFGYLGQIEGGIGNFREIPLLIYVFYVRKPRLIILTSLIASFPISNATNFTHFENFLIHFPGLVAAWAAYAVLSRFDFSAATKGIIWTLIGFSYYAIFLIPTWSIVSFIDFDSNFIDNYYSGLKSVRFEMIATTFITGLYLIQKEVRNNLIEYQRDLEKIVEKRTEELEEANKNLLAANEELNVSNEKIWTINENLDELVKQRSAKIEEQLTLLNKYAHMNSHEVRAPLARLLGLMSLINLEKDAEAKIELFDKMNACAEEMDQIIRKMNRLLEKEIIPPSISVED
jgi:K+-sensing histidine kinase KdpD